MKVVMQAMVRMDSQIPMDQRLHTVETVINKVGHTQLYNSVHR
jgi:hypothetical protein